jgi:hypothetical protein
MSPPAIKTLPLVSNVAAGLVWPVFISPVLTNAPLEGS